MPIHTLIITFLILAVCALLVVNKLHTRALRKKLIHTKLLSAKRDIARLKQQTSIVETVTGNNAITQVVFEECLDIIQSLLSIEPNSSTIQHEEKRMINLLEEQKTKSENITPNRMCSHESMVQLIQMALSDVIFMIKKRLAKEAIHPTTANQMIHEIMWAHDVTPVITQTVFGLKAQKAGSPSHAMSYFYKSLETIKNAKTEHETKTQWIDELNELISGSRTALSNVLIPEIESSPLHMPNAIQSPAQSNAN